MNIGDEEKVLIVEGKSDKIKVREVLNEPLDIVCTNGTIGQTELEDLADRLFDKDVYILVDADDSGEKLRKQLKRELPEARHIYIDRTYREVEASPSHHLASVLLRAGLNVNSVFLKKKDLRW
ncbi:toprim domain-containing protein [Bacillus nakamurai]|uniref:toprim domain-containing protein n=1 Tax=Bacillus nakamurai TaxID=1793963 RepID=UPI0020C1F15F|nr:toprim domain-containing protein [Bacillus nakamurai]MCP6681704.1 toprim domain-containing protein [Bacillus nakamurai]